MWSLAFAYFQNFKNFCHILWQFEWCNIVKNGFVLSILVILGKIGVSTFFSFLESGVENPVCGRNELFVYCLPAWSTSYGRSWCFRSQNIAFRSVLELFWDCWNWFQCVLVPLVSICTKPLWHPVISGWGSYLGVFRGFLYNFGYSERYPDMSGLS